MKGDFCLFSARFHFKCGHGAVDLQGLFQMDGPPARKLETKRDRSVVGATEQTRVDASGEAKIDRESEARNAADWSPSGPHSDLGVCPRT